MKLYTICPNPYNNHNTYKPQEGIKLSFVENVPCLDPRQYGRESDTLEAMGIDPRCHILPVMLTESTKKEIEQRKKLTEERKQKYKSKQPINKEDYKLLQEPICINYATVHLNSKSITFLKEEAYTEDQEVIVSLELPLSAAQPYYEFEGDTEILLGNYVIYQGKDYEVEKEDALCSGIIKMCNGSKLSFIYTNHCGHGVAITWIMGIKFEFICHNGKLTRLDEHQFSSLYSDFKID